MSENRRAELAAFLRAQRGRLRPADVGLPADLEPGRRRTPGLRREEVADLAGVSLTWYTWLEQGRRIDTSSQVADALARALRLDEAKHRHLRRLAGLPEPLAENTPAPHTDRLQRLVDALLPSPAVVHDGRLDFVVWNRAFALVRFDPATLPGERRNLLWWMLTDEVNRSAMHRWEAAARAVLSQFRGLVGARPDDPRLLHLVAALEAVSPEFRQWWSEYSVSEFRPTTIGLTHPVLGELELELFQLRPVDHPQLLLVVQRPATDDGLRRIRALLDQS
ncbi:helix-turn-helix transcriptional regulator [Nocardia neocaledoniensis]|uniref:helix-turn-helix transcriptional regulator n=1 Tax=Nocardia neocaledoniensis TaxID=236511 RepID=UPI002457E610|nr:helix-turn-helix transcriptional regulator [Nocardia neocaledoniensis]